MMCFLEGLDWPALSDCKTVEPTRFPTRARQKKNLHARERVEACSLFVIAGHSRLKDGVASARHARQSILFE
jgi:hypothetical protein